MKQKFKKVLFAFAAIAIIATGCNKENEIVPAKTKPVQGSGHLKSGGPITITSPAAQTTAGVITISGTASSPGYTYNAMSVYMDGAWNSGKAGIGLTYNPTTKAFSGTWDLTATTIAGKPNPALTIGQHTLYVYAQNTITGQLDLATAYVYTDVITRVQQPTTNKYVTGNVTVKGWAVCNNNLDPINPGVNAIDFYLDGPCCGGGGTYLGGATYGEPRTDVDLYFGGTGTGRFKNSGFTFNWNTAGLSAGAHTLYIYTRRTADNAWAPYQTIQVNVSDPIIKIQSPAADASISGNTLTVGGWAACQNDYVSGTGVDQVDVYLDGNKIGTASYDYPNSDATATLGSKYTNSGFTFTTDWNPLWGNITDWHQITVNAHNPATGNFYSQAIAVNDIEPVFWMVRDLNSHIPYYISVAKIKSESLCTRGYTAPQRFYKVYIDKTKTSFKLSDGKNYVSIGGSDPLNYRRLAIIPGSSGDLFSGNAIIGFNIGWDYYTDEVTSTDYAIVSINGSPGQFEFIYTPAP